MAGTIGGKTVGAAQEVTLFDLKALGCDGGGSNAGVVYGKQPRNTVMKSYSYTEAIEMPL